MACHREREYSIELTLLWWRRECGCGEGDSGCAECGCCRICAKENVDNSELAILGPSGAGDIAGMMRLDLIFGGNYQMPKRKNLCTCEFSVIV
jgi:hypothetical protein